MEKATLAFEPTFDGICQMFDTIVDIMITAVVETPRVEQGLFQVSLLWWIQDFPKGGSQPPDGRGGHQPIIWQIFTGKMHVGFQQNVTL